MSTVVNVTLVAPEHWNADAETAPPTPAASQPRKFEWRTAKEPPTTLMAPPSPAVDRPSKSEFVTFTFAAKARIAVPSELEVQFAKVALEMSS